MIAHWSQKQLTIPYPYLVFLKWHFVAESDRMPLSLCILLPPEMIRVSARTRESLGGGRLEPKFRRDREILTLLLIESCAHQSWSSLQVQRLYVRDKYGDQALRSMPEIAGLLVLSLALAGVPQCSGVRQSGAADVAFITRPAIPTAQTAWRYSGSFLQPAAKSKTEEVGPNSDQAKTR
jgi:hypothetical protein